MNFKQDIFGEKFSDAFSRNFPTFLQKHQTTKKRPFFILDVEVYYDEVTYDTTYKLLYDTTKTVPGGAIYHDYTLAFNIDIKNTTKYTLKYKVLNMKEDYIFKTKTFLTNNHLSRFQIGRQAELYIKQKPFY